MSETPTKFRAMRVIGTIRSTATERITVEASSYQEARELLETQIPEGHELIAIRTDTDDHAR